MSRRDRILDGLVNVVATAAGAFVLAVGLGFLVLSALGVWRWFKGADF